MTSPAAMSCTDWSNVVQVARNWPAFFSSINLSAVKSISFLVILPLLPYLMRSALSKHSAASMMPIAGTSRMAALPLNLGSSSSFHSVDLMADQIGPVADRVGIVDLRQEGHVVGHAFVQLGVGGLGDVHRLVGRDALAWNLVALELALGEDR